METATWRDLDDQTVAAARVQVGGLLTALLKRKAPVEAETEDKLVYPALRVLGWEHISVQQRMDARGRTTTLEFDFPPLPRPGQGGGKIPENDEDPQPETYQMTPGPTRIVDPLGRTTIVDYCDSNAMANLPPNEFNRCIVMPVPVSVTDPEGIKTVFVTDYFSRNVLQRTQNARPGSLQPNGQPWPDLVTHATYSCIPATARSCNKPLTATDARGNVTEYAYAPEHGGLLTETLPAPSPGAPRPQTRHTYGLRQGWILGGAAGPPVWVRLATSACRTSAATGNPAAPCSAPNDETRTTSLYGPDGGPAALLLVGQEVSDGATVLRTCYGYDSRGRRISETQPNALLAACPAAAPAAATPYTASTRYDAMGRVTGTISASPLDNPFLAARTFHDGAGRPVRVETGALAAWQSEAVAPAAWSGFTIFRTLESVYDVMGRKARDSLREGAAGAVRTVTQYSYDALGRLECTAVRMNPAGYGALPASACTPGTAGSDGPDRITRTVFDAAGQRVQLREGVGTSDEAAEATWAYSLNGQVTAVIDGNGNRAALAYDGHGRQERWTFPSTIRPAAYDDTTPASALATAGSVNPSDYEQYGYDLVGNRTSLRKRDGATLTFQHDNLNRMIVKVVPERAGLAATHTRDAYYGYDLQGLQLFARFDSPAGEGVTNGYDAFGRLVSHGTDMGGTTRALSYQYDANSNRTDIHHPQGPWFSTLHDALGRPYWLIASATGIASTSIAFANHHPHGAPWVVTRPGGATGFDYDPVQRPYVRAHHFAGEIGNVYWVYGHNSAGQIGSAFRDNDDFAWTGHYPVSRAYAANGLNQYTAAGAASFAYDPNGNLSWDGARTYGYDIENRLISASPNLTLSYDPLGRPFEVIGASGTTRFLYDGDALVAEYDGAGAMLRRHVHWPGADVPMITYEGAGLSSPRQLYADHQGSIVAHAAGNGNRIAINRYDEYGIPASTNTGRFQYTGQIWIPELGMYHYKSRVYSPTLGRFLQTDSVGYEGGINLYAYVGNDPLNFVDPNGQGAIMVRNNDGSRTLIIPVQITVRGGTPQEQAAVRAEIVARANALQTDDTTMRIQVVATDQRIGEVLNRLTYASGDNRQMCPTTGECTNSMGGDTAHINRDNHESIGAAAHDILHFAGIDEGYTEGLPDAAGNRTSTLRPGYTEQDIMARRSGTRVTRGQFNEAGRNRSTRQMCEGMRGQPVRCPR